MCGQLKGSIHCVIVQNNSSAQKAISNPFYGLLQYITIKKKIMHPSIAHIYFELCPLIDNQQGQTGNSWSQRLLANQEPMVQADDNNDWNVRN
jgi:hypothetical protein